MILTRAMFEAFPKTGPYAWKSWAETFASKYVLLQNGCWAWNGSLYRNGYGGFAFGTTRILAHRVAYAIYKGDVPEHLVIRHTCDYKRCGNPDHLILGTHKENSDDAWARNRIDRKKLGAGRRRIPHNDLHIIFEMRTAGMLQREIAEKFGVRPNQIS
jgi:hypothetical protein